MVRSFFTGSPSFRQSACMCAPGLMPRFVGKLRPRRILSNRAHIQIFRHRIRRPQRDAFGIDPRRAPVPHSSLADVAHIHRAHLREGHHRCSQPHLPGEARRHNDRGQQPQNEPHDFFSGKGARASLSPTRQPGKCTANGREAASFPRATHQGNPTGSPTAPPYCAARAFPPAAARSAARRPAPAPPRDTASAPTSPACA